MDSQGGDPMDSQGGVPHGRPAAYVRAYVRTYARAPHRPWGGRVVSHQKATSEPYEQLQVQVPEALDIIIYKEAFGQGQGLREDPSPTRGEIRRCNSKSTIHKREAALASQVHGRNSPDARHTDANFRVQ